YAEVAERISSFIGELLEMMQSGKPEQYIVMRIRRVGAIHFQHGIPFPSAVWREFKSSVLSIISECEFKSHEERQSALDAWNIFISFIIREMKMGTWAMGDTLSGIS
ncbi:hypothetical protein OESDEN_11538, partial [Oesophagostomum dentatum]